MKITLELTACTLGYDLRTLEVRRTGERYLVLHELKRVNPDAMVGMALDELSASLEWEGPRKPLHHFVIGNERTVYEPPRSVSFFESVDSLPDCWRKGEPLWTLEQKD